MSPTREAWIAAPMRTPFTRATKGPLASTRPDELLATLFRRILADHPEVRDRVDDVIVGCAYPEAEQGRNVARAVTLAAGLPDSTPAMTLTRMCASSLEAVAIGAAKVRLGEASLVLVGGVESMSRIPMGGVQPSPNPDWLEQRPEIYMAMGHTAERVAQRFHIARGDQDDWALRSHQRAQAARARGVFREEIVPVLAAVAAHVVAPAPSNRPAADPADVTEDDAIRPDSTKEKLALLAPAFDEKGTVTAGNACPTSDGASALLVASSEAIAELGLRPLGRMVSYATAGVDPALMGIGPVEAVSKALARAGPGVTLERMDRIELNEAFASQVLAVIRTLGLPEERLNVNGGAIALGHPLGATGARLVGTLLRELARSGGRYGLATLCVGGGMGAAMVLEKTEP